MPNQVVAAITGPGWLRHKSATASRASNAVFSWPTTKIAAWERNQFNIHQARAMNSVSIQKISSEVPGAGFVFEEAAPASSIAPSEPTMAANIAAARKQFKTMSE